MASQAVLDRDFPIDPQNQHAKNGYDLNHPDLLAIRAIPDHWTRLNAEFAYFGVPESSGEESRGISSNAKKPR